MIHKTLPGFVPHQFSFISHHVSSSFICIYSLNSSHTQLLESFLVYHVHSLLSFVYSFSLVKSSVFFRAYLGILQLVFLDKFPTASKVPWTSLNQSIWHPMVQFLSTFMAIQLNCDRLNGREGAQFIFVSLSFTTKPSVMGWIVSPPPLTKGRVEVLTTSTPNVILFVNKIFTDSTKLRWGH